jgi:HAD superfamily hydrolase (TIGR01509 family)
VTTSTRPLPGAVLFDFDGTIADSLPVITDSLMYALDTEGFKATREQVLAVIGPPLSVMVELLAGALTDDQRERVVAAYFAHFNANLDRIEPLPGALELLDALAAREIPLAMVTNKSEASAGRQLAALGWVERFAVLVGADNAPRPKPAPDLALLALRRLGVEATSTAFVGDNEADMLCASTAGIPIVVGLAIAGNEVALERAGATYVAHSLEEVEAVLLRGDSICA